MLPDGYGYGGCVVLMYAFVYARSAYTRKSKYIYVSKTVARCLNISHTHTLLSLVPKQTYVQLLGIYKQTFIYTLLTMGKDSNNPAVARELVNM